MRFKFGIAVSLSVAIHISLFALAIYLPRHQKNGGTIYYVDLMQLPGGGGGGGAAVTKGGGGQPELTGSLRDLTVRQEETTEAKLRYPDLDKKKQAAKTKREKKEKEKLVTVVKKQPPKDDKTATKPEEKNRGVNPAISVNRSAVGGSGDLTAGISAGTGGGSGGGSGGGTGAGTGGGSGIGNFPYAYYIESLKARISSSWYSSLVSPGLKGQHTVTVYFRIQRNGMIADLNIESASGNESLDMSAIRAVKAASPFPQLPPDFPHQYLGVHFEFKWARQ